MRQKAGARASHQEKLLSIGLLKRKLFSLPFLNLTPIHSLLDPWLNLGTEEKR